MRNIVLIGMPGSGKSTIGVLLAKAIGKDFMDTDLVLMRQTGRKLQDYLDKEGLDAFLSQENKTILSIACDNTVIATGGSVVLEKEAMNHLKANDSTVIFIDVDLDELTRRITNIKSRGIAFAPGQTLEDIYEERKPLYEKYADIRIQVSKKQDIEASVEEIVQRIQSSEGC